MGRRLFTLPSKHWCSVAHGKGYQSLSVVGATASPVNPRCAIELPLFGMESGCGALEVVERYTNSAINILTLLISMYVYVCTTLYYIKWSYR
jgi:hypothetical protein